MEHDSKVTLAEKLLAEAKANVVKWETFLRAYRELDVVTPSGGADIPTPTRNPVNGIHGLKGSKLTVTERVAAAIIREAGRPVPSGELLKALLERGVDVGGQSPSATLAARLSRAKTVEFQKGLGWALSAEGAEK